MKRGIKLVAIYIGKFGIFENEILNFSSDYTVTLSESTGNKISLLVKYQKKLPENFFSTDSSTGGCVSSVSAIIGKNGTGKTMIARLLCRMASPDNELEEGKIVLVYERNGKIKVYPFCKRTEIAIKFEGMDTASSPPPSDPSAPQNHETGLPFKFFYYSPYYTTEQYDWDMGDEGNTVYNISTTWLMWHPEGNSETYSKDVPRLKIFEMDEKLRVLEFCAAYAREIQKISDSPMSPQRNRRSEKIREFTIPVPQGVSIAPHIEGMQHAIRQIRNYVSERARVDDEHNPVRSYLKSLLPFLELHWSYSDFFTRVLVAYVSRYLQECGLLGNIDPSIILREGTFLAALKDFLVPRIGTEAMAPKEVIEFFTAHPPPKDAKALKLSGRSEDNKSQVATFFRSLANLCSQKGETDDAGRILVRQEGHDAMHCRNSDRKTSRLVNRLVRMHALVTFISPFLTFDIFPKMSSGEMSFLSMFSRLYRFIRKMTRKGDDVAIFLDEAETTLHPEWQRSLVDYFIRFLEVFIPDRHYQLVFASHSPMLLSDIPSGNCCFLQTDEGRGKASEMGNRGRSLQTLDVNQYRGQKRSQIAMFRQDEDCENTFGANIYDLYRGGFFLPNGTIGQFSSRVIDEHLKMIAEYVLDPNGRKQVQKPSSDDETLLIQALIGDRVVQRYFKVLKEQGLI